MDALATPFVQGRLTRRELAGVLHSECAHCGEPFEVAFDHELRCRVLTPGASPLVSVPIVNFKKLRDPSIIDAF